MTSTVPKSMKLEIHPEFCFQSQVAHEALDKTRLLGFVVKNTPFEVRLKVVAKSKLSLQNAHVKFQLVTEDSYTPVAIGAHPVTWEVNGITSTEIFCSTRLTVLYTQVKSCVIIKATVSLDGNSKPLEAMSCAIKVLSKPEQIRRLREEAGLEPEWENSKKRARTGDVLDYAYAIENALKPRLEALMDAQNANPLFSALNADPASINEFVDHDEPLSYQDVAYETHDEPTEDDGDEESCAPLSPPYGDPYSHSDDATYDLSLDESVTTITTNSTAMEADNAALTHFEPPAKRPCSALASAFENVLHSYAALPSLDSHSMEQLSRIRNLLEAVGLPGTVTQAHTSH